MNNPVPVEYVSSFTQANQSLMLHLATELLGEGGRIGDFQRFAELAQVRKPCSRTSQRVSRTRITRVRVLTSRLCSRYRRQLHLCCT